MKPNLLIISNYRDPIAPIRAEAEILLRLKKRGFNITIITPKEGTYPKILQDEGCELIDHIPSSKFDRHTISLIKRTVENRNINIVHAFNSKAIANAAWALWNNEKVKLVTYRGYTGNIHWYDPSLYISFLNPRIDHMVCLAESVREMYLKNGVKPSRATTINKGHSAEWYADIQPSDLSEFGLSDDALICALVANSRTTMKGVQYVVEAASFLKVDCKVHFLMIGNGLINSEIEAVLEKHGVKDKFTFTGFRTDAANLVKASDVSISASLFGEATQKAVIEAMHLGKPVIMTDISGNKGMGVHGETGFIVPIKDSGAIADAIMQLYNSPELISRMGESAKKHISSFLSIDRSVEEYVNFYARIVSE